MDQPITNTNEKPATKNKHPNSVTLKPEHQDKINRWIKQLTEKNPGVRVTRKDLIWWIVDAQPETLAHGDVAKLSARFYDEEKFLRETLRAMRTCRKEGRPFDLKVTIKESRPRKPRSPKKNWEETAL